MAVTVADHGIGIAAEQAEHAFESFRRLAQRDTGCGIGLTLCRRIVVRHGGRIRIEPRPGGGTAVSFGLRAVPASGP